MGGKNFVAPFEKAKNNSLARACDVTASYMPIPWLPTNIESLSDTFAGDLWPYGVEPNKLRWTQSVGQPDGVPKL